MKTIAELEQLKNELIDNFYREGQVLAGWTSLDVAGMDKEGDEVKVVKANSQLMASQAASISSLNNIIKQARSATPRRDAAEEALRKIRGDE